MKYLITTGVIIVLAVILLGNPADGPEYRFDMDQNVIEVIK